MLKRPRRGDGGHDLNSQDERPADAVANHLGYFEPIATAFGAFTPEVTCWTKLPPEFSSVNELLVLLPTHKSPPPSKASDEGPLRLPDAVKGELL